jgi:beta-lactam-binding protein with PASTA domain
MELYYEAQDMQTEEKVCLIALLPMRWCMQDENGSWVPYHEAALTEWNTVRAGCLARLEQLRQFSEESALMSISDVFEERGTVWYVTPLQEMQSLAVLLRERLYTPQEAIDLLAPVMDTLAGLHSTGFFHGAVTEQAVMTNDGRMVLTDWNARFCTEYEKTAGITSDVQAVSRILYRMMTGESSYSRKTASALPRGVAQALYNGMKSETMGMEQLWQQLFSDTPVRRKRAVWTHTKRPVFLTRRFVIIFCLLCCILPLGLQLLLSGGGNLPDRVYALAEGEIRVPELLYLTQEEAVQQAEALGLHVIIAAREDNPVVPEGSVVVQSPSAGAVLSAGDSVMLTVSDGWANYVPNVCNMLFEDARNALEELGFIVEYEEIMSPEAAPGTVIAQSVEPEVKLARDSVITLTVSLGREDLDTSKLETVGNYVGMDFEEAKRLLSEIYLYAFQAETVYDPDVPAGVIISQDIPEGEQVPQGTLVNMVVSLGVETVRVPGVTLMNAGSAKAMLEEMNLKAVIVYVADGRYAMDCVISQDVSAGTLLPVGSEVWLTVSIGSSSYVISTGGWSGNPLPTVETESEAASEALPEETESAASHITETDPSEQTTPAQTPYETDTLPIVTEGDEPTQEDTLPAETEDTAPPSEAAEPTEPPAETEAPS